MEVPLMEDRSSELDPQNMLAHVRGLPEQCRAAWRSAMDFDLPADFSRAESVLVIGMGGSAIGGDLVSSLLAPEASLPVNVLRGYELPAYVDERTLVIASSNSGNTEETLAAFGQALDSPAMKLVITRGGRLKALADEHGIPAFTFDLQSQPRAALGFGFLPLLCFMQKLSFISSKSPDVAEAVAVMEKLKGGIDAEVPLDGNPARKLAARLAGQLPVVYGGAHLAEVAHRWKTQFNENSKAWAFFEAFPELNHNAVVGYQFPVELADRIVVIMLRSARLPRPILRRYEVTRQLLERAGVSHEIVDATGDSALSQMLGLVLFGDYVSYYLALEYQVDPTPVEAIDFLKQKLADSA